MGIQELKDKMPEYAKDAKLNLGRVVTVGSAEGINQNQAWGIALASAYASRNAAVIREIADEAGSVLSAEEITAAKGAASLMGMNNVYYRFVHLASDAEYAKMPAQLRMNFMANPGVEKIDFELMSLAVSAINGCGMCIDSHVKQITESGISRKGVQTTIRIASVISAVAQTLEIEEFSA